MEPRRHLSVAIAEPYHHAAEGNRVGFFADFTSDTRPVDIYGSFGDGMVYDASARGDVMYTWDPASGRGVIYGLHAYDHAGRYATTFTVEGRGGTIDSTTFFADVSAPDAGDGLAFGGDPLAPADSLTESGASSGATTAPQVSAVFVSGTGWAPAFKSYLATTGAGDATYGYAVPAFDQLNELPWSTLDQISIRFSEDVIVEQSDLLAAGVNTPAYTTSGFAYDEATFTATWTLPAYLSKDKVLLHLSNLVQDLDGERLDGEWANNGAGPDAFPSGNESAGGAFDFRVNLLPGDTTRSGKTDALDVSDVKRRENRSTSNPGPGDSTSYTIFHDLDGDGVITNVEPPGPPGDVQHVKANLTAVLPAGDPVLPAFSLPPSGLEATVVSDTRIDLEWTDTSSDESGFLIEASLNGTAFYEIARVAPGSTSFAFAEALPNTEHSFRLATLNRAGHSSFSGSAAVTPIPRAPEGLTATEVSTTQIDLTWEAVDGLSNYLVERRTGTDVTWESLPPRAPTDSTYSDTGLTEATRYDYRLRALNASGASAYSEVEGTDTLPASPTGLGLVQRGGQRPHRLL